MQEPLVDAIVDVRSSEHRHNTISLEFAGYFTKKMLAQIVSDVTEIVKADNDRIDSNWRITRTRQKPGSLFIENDKEGVSAETANELVQRIGDKLGEEIRVVVLPLTTLPVRVKYIRSDDASDPTNYIVRLPHGLQPHKVNVAATLLAYYLTLFGEPSIKFDRIIHLVDERRRAGSKMLEISHSDMEKALGLWAEALNLTLETEVGTPSDEDCANLINAIPLPGMA